MKENKILKLIYVAWRERWTDSQFGINIKTVLPRGVSGDVYNLADCLIQQALIGSTANKLVLDHLKHSLCSHLVSHAAVIQSIAKFEQIKRIYCVISLLEFLETIIDGICCRTKSEESLLPTALLKLVLWLMKNILAVAKFYELRNELTTERSYMLEKACNCINKITGNEFLMIIYHVGCKDSPELAQEIFEEYVSIKSILTETNFTFPQLITEESLHKLAYLDLNHFVIPYLDTENVEGKNEIITYCMQPLLSAEVCLHPSKDTNYYVTEIKMVQKLRRYTNARLFYELIRAAFMTISINDETSHDIMWGAFTFFKLPQILKSLSDFYRSSNPKAPTDFATEMVEAFDMLFEDTMFVDCFSTKCSETICESFLKEWMNMNLITEAHMKRFMTIREESQCVLQEPNEIQTQPAINLIIRAEVPLSGFLKTLNADYNKVQEALLGVLNQVLVGNSFELILSVAMVEGHIKTFVSRLIQCNENSVPIPNDTSNKQTTRSLLFDVSFLMLTSIIQKYGAEAVLPDTPGESFFEQWARETMFERNTPKPYKTILDACDDTIVDDILTSLTKTDTPINSSITWQDICKNLPKVIYHVLIAWEVEAISSADVKNILDNMKSQLCTYSVIATSFLCVYMDGVNENDLLKPLNMIQQFLTHPAAKTPSSTPTPNEEESPTKENQNERLGLLFQIIRNFQQNSLQPSNPKPIVLRDPLIEKFNEVFKEIKTLGWVPINSAKELESLLTAAGPAWFTKNLVNEMIKCRYVGDMAKTMDIVFGIFHLDIEENTVAFLQEVLPDLILRREGKEMYEPQFYILARLGVHCIISCLELQQLNGCLKKRSRSVGSENDENDSVNNAKQRKINPEGAENSCSNDFISDSNLLLGATNSTASTTTTNPNGATALSSTGNSNDSLSASTENPTKSLTNENSNGVLSSLTTSTTTNTASNGNKLTTNGTESSNTLVLREPLEGSLSHLFKILQKLVSTDELSPKVVFVFQFISLLVEHGLERVRPVLRLLPNNLIQNLLKLLLNDEIKVGLIARLYDLGTTTGRHQAVSDLCLLRNIQLRKSSSINL